MSTTDWWLTSLTNYPKDMYILRQCLLSWRIPNSFNFLFIYFYKVVLKESEGKLRAKGSLNHTTRVIVHSDIRGQLLLLETCWYGVQPRRLGKYAWVWWKGKSRPFSPLPLSLWSLEGHYMSALSARWVVMEANGSPVSAGSTPAEGASIPCRARNCTNPVRVLTFSLFKADDL